jgi:hypothetical protein
VLNVVDLVKSVDPLVEMLAVLVALWLVYRAITGSWRIWMLGVGVDGRYSSSLVHGLAWTVVVVGAYVLLYLCRVHVGSTGALGAFPPNVLTALGLSLGTTVTAAGITSGRVARDPGAKSKADPADRTFASLVEDDGGRPSLVKTQLMIWTIVSLGIYIVATADAATRTLATTNAADLPGLPDIDRMLLVLSGIGQATYLAHKVVAGSGGGGTPDAEVDPTTALGQLAALAGPAPSPVPPSGPSGGGAAQAAVAASIHATVTVPVSVRVPGFQPSVNGLHFINSFPHEAELSVDLPGIGSLGIGDASNGLCGGMAFTVRDVFQTPGMKPVATTTLPAAGSPLYRYIVDRLIASFDIPNLGFLRYYEWMMTPDADAGWPPLLLRRGIAWKTIVEEWPARIRPELDAGRLCSLGLVTVAGSNPAELGQNHQVLAYGYDLDASGNLKVLLYDPNTPVDAADQVSISLNLNDPSHATPMKHNVAIAHPIRGFFRTDYGYRNPTGLLG